MASIRVGSINGCESITTRLTRTSQNHVRGPFIAGPPGKDAPPNYGFGQISYSRPLQGVDEILPADTRTQMLFEAAPSLTQDLLNAPFKGHNYWANNQLIPRAQGDLIQILINLQVRSIVSGGILGIDLDIGSPLGPAVSDTATLLKDTSQTERVSMTLTVQCLSYFMQNMGRLFYTSTVPLVLVKESLLIYPLSIQQG